MLGNRYHKDVDFVGLFERLRPDLAKALHLAGEEFSDSEFETSLPENVSNYELIDVSYSPELREVILESEKSIIDRFYR